MNVHFESIADGLAEQGYAIIDQFLSQDELTAIRESENFTRGLDHFHKAGIGKMNSHQINEAVRGDYIQWIDRGTANASIKVYLERLQSLITYVNQSLYLSLKDYEVHLTIYPTGSFYKRHLDQFRQDDHRRLSIICYLNQDWNEEQGGQLRMHLKDGPLDILPVGGRLVCFRSDLIEHEVLPATRERLSLTGWILDQYAGLRHL
jgi:SM-20-related protein